MKVFRAELQIDFFNVLLMDWLATRTYIDIFLSL